MSNIEWTTKTWNPIVGCTKVSPGCKLCYAEKMHKRIVAAGQSLAYTRPFHLKVVERRDKINEPRRWKKPQKVFVNSMSDFFHQKVSDEFRLQLYQTMVECPQHTFQVLTKRAAEMHHFFNRHVLKGRVPANIHVGVSVENLERAHERIPLLMSAELPVRFLSVEPLLGDISEYLYANEEEIRKKIHWIIVGGESGPKKKVRPMELGWANKIAEFCEKNNIRYFFKQTGSTIAYANRFQSKKGGDEREWPKLGNEFPITMYRREYPK